jgi:hypothetical protein
MQFDYGLGLIRQSRGKLIILEMSRIKKTSRAPAKAPRPNLAERFRSRVMPVPETIVMLEKGTKNDPILILDEDVDYGEGAGTAEDPIELKEVGEDAQIKVEE